MMINHSFSIAKYINENTKIVDVIKNYVSLFKKGNNYLGICPFHEDTHPSLSVSPQKNIFKCFACNTKGDVINFVQQFKKISFKDSINEIVKLTNLQIPNQKANAFLNNNHQNFNQSKLLLNEFATYFYHRSLLSKLDNLSLDYSEKTLRFFEIGYSQNSSSYLELVEAFNNSNDSKLVNVNQTDLIFFQLFENALVVPVKDQSQNVMGFYTIDRIKSDEYKSCFATINYWTNFNHQKPFLYNYFNFDKSKTDKVYFVDNIFKVFTLKEQGIDNVLFGAFAHISQPEIELIKKDSNIQKVVFCLENPNNLNEKIMQPVVSSFFKNHFQVYLVNDLNDINHHEAPYLNYEVDRKLNKNQSEDELQKNFNETITTLKKFYHPLFISDAMQLMSSLSNVSFDKIEKMVKKQPKQLEKEDYER